MNVATQFIPQALQLFLNQLAQHIEEGNVPVEVSNGPNLDSEEAPYDEDHPNPSNDDATNTVVASVNQAIQDNDELTVESADGSNNHDSSTSTAQQTEQTDARGGGALDEQ